MYMCTLIGSQLKVGFPTEPILGSSNLENIAGVPAMKLLDQVRHVARVKHFSYRTEQCYIYWVTRYIRYQGLRHPNTLSTKEVEQFLTHLAVDGNVSASTQNQALGALLFLYRDVLHQDIGTLDA